MKAPDMILKTDDTMVWYLKDDTFDMPRCYIRYKVYTTDLGFGSGPSKRMFARVWENVLAEY